jgi:hypothetical protein
MLPEQPNLLTGPLDIFFILLFLLPGHIYLTHQSCRLPLNESSNRHDICCHCISLSARYRRFD